MLLNVTEEIEKFYFQAKTKSRTSLVVLPVTVTEAHDEA